MKRIFPETRTKSNSCFLSFTSNDSVSLSRSRSISQPVTVSFSFRKDTGLESISKSTASRIKMNPACAMLASVYVASPMLYHLPHLWPISQSANPVSRQTSNAGCAYN